MEPSGVENRRSRLLDDADAAVPVWSDGGAMASAAVQTPWLLLALGSGSFTWSDDAADEEVACAIAMADMVQTDGTSDASVLPLTDGALAPPLSAAGNVEGRESPVMATRPRQIALFVEPATSWERTSSSGTDLVSGRHAVQEGASPVEAPPAVPAGASGAGLGEPALSAAARDGVAPSGPTVGNALDTPAVTVQAGHLSTGTREATVEAGRVEGQDAPAPSPLATSTPAATLSARVDVAAGLAHIAGQRQGPGRREESVHTIDIGSVIAGQMPAPVVHGSVPAAPAVVVPAANAEHVVEQIVMAVRMQWKDGIGEAKLQLRPDALGTVTVALRVEAGAVTAVVRAESAQVQEWVLRNQESLRQQLEASGLHLDELVVSPDDRGQQERQPDPEQAPRRRPTPRGTSTTGSRFEQLL